jgi:glycosyltransferase involved in cell wall biosynthesis
MSEPTYSFVIPIHDEEESLRELHQRLAALLETLDGPAEVIFVDDGSRDASYPIMVELNRNDPRFKVVSLSRNFGHQLALTAGLDFARGDAVIVMDGDLQHPPEVVPDLVARWREGYEVVFAVMRERTEGWLKRTTARSYYRILRRMSDVDVPEAAGDFRLVDRGALDAFREMRERNRYVRGMFSWIGFRQIGVPYECPPRFAGKSKYTFGRMLKLGRDGIVSFSNLPLQLVLNLGFAVSAASFIVGIAAIVVKAAGLFVVPGWASIVVIVSFMGGIQLIVLGVIGEYVARVYDEVKHRPLYVVHNLHGFDEADVGSRTPTRASAR